MIGALVERLHSSSTPSSEDIEAIRSLPLFIKQVEAHHFVGPRWAETDALLSGRGRSLCAD